MQPFLVAALLSLAMAVCVNHHQDKNNKATSQQQDKKRLVPPDFRHQGAKIFKEIRIHPKANLHPGPIKVKMAIITKNND
jgi:hypothetical protein